MLSRWLDSVLFSLEKITPQVILFSGGGELKKKRKQFKTNTDELTKNLELPLDGANSSHPPDPPLGLILSLPLIPSPHARKKEN